MDGAQVSVFEKRDEVRLRSFLEGQDSSSLETEVVPQILGDFTNETLERELSDQKIGRPLAMTDPTKSDSTWSVSV